VCAGDVLQAQDACATTSYAKPVMKPLLVSYRRRNGSSMSPARAEAGLLLLTYHAAKHAQRSLLIGSDDVSPGYMGTDLAEAMASPAGRARDEPGILASYASYVQATASTSAPLYSRHTLSDSKSRPISPSECADRNAVYADARWWGPPPERPISSPLNDGASVDKRSPRVRVQRAKREIPLNQAHAIRKLVLVNVSNLMISDAPCGRNFRRNVVENSVPVPRSHGAYLARNKRAGLSASAILQPRG
jgi:hypothetical protein